MALLRLLRVKRSLLDLRSLYQFLDPIEQSLIGESGRQTLVMRDLAVEFDAPVTHCIPPLFLGRGNNATCHLLRRKRQFCFNAPRHFLATVATASGINKSISHHRRVNNPHRQAVAGFIDLRCDTWRRDHNHRRCDRWPRI
jgi:hypothetical protein